jgi:hypothetical protein
MRFCLSQPLFNQIDFVFWRLDPLFRLLLKRMKYVDGEPEFDGEDGSICAPIIVLDNFKHARSTETFERLCGDMLRSDLSLIERNPISC